MENFQFDLVKLIITSTTRHIRIQSNSDVLRKFFFRFQKMMKSRHTVRSASCVEDEHAENT